MKNLLLFLSLGIFPFGVWAQIDNALLQKPLEELTFEEARKATNQLKSTPEENKYCEKTYRYARRTIELAEQEFGMDDYLQFGRSIQRLAHIHFSCGDLEGAFEVLKENNLKIAKKGDRQHPIIGSNLCFIGRLHMSNGNFEKAIHYGNQGLEMIRATASKTDLIYLDKLEQVAYIYYEMGQYEKAIELYEERNKHYQRQYGAGSKFPMGMAILYRDMGQYEKALPIYQDRLQHVGKLRGIESQSYGRVLFQIGQLYTQMGQYKKALDLLKTASEIIGKSTGINSGWYGRTQNALGEVYRNTGEYEKALEAFQIAYNNYVLDYYKEHPDCSVYLSQLAEMHGLMGQLDQAFPLIEEALSIVENSMGNGHPEYAAGLSTKANLYQSQGAFEAASLALEQALKIAKQSLGDLHPDYGLYSNSLANNYEVLGNIDKAYENYLTSNQNACARLQMQFDHFSEKEQIALFSTLQEQFDQYQSFTFRQVENQNLAASGFNNALLVKGLLLDNRRKMLWALKNSSDSKTANQFQEWEKLNRQLSRQYSLPIENRLPNFEVLENQVNELESSLARISRNFKSARKSVEWKDIQGSLKEGEAAIEFAHFNYYEPGNRNPGDSVLYVAYLLKNNSEAPQVIPLFEEKEIGNLKAIVRLYDFNKRGTRPNLYELIAKPLQPHLEDVATIYFASSGILHYLNLGAIPVSETITFSDQFELHNLGSTRQILEKTEIIAPDTYTEAMLYGGVNYHTEEQLPLFTSVSHSEDIIAFADNFSSLGNAFRTYRGNDWHPLEWTAREVEDLKMLLSSSGKKTTVLSNVEATEDSFKAIGTHAPSPKILHLATHGYFFPDPNSHTKRKKAPQTGFQTSEHPMIRSGLILAGANHVWKGGTPQQGKEDGILTAYEIAQMDLSNTELVVLSACETGLGDIQGSEGVYGLQRAFKLAGAKYLLMSLWSVNDESTYEFMTTFYQEWLENEKSIPQAYQAAQQILKAKYSEPFNPQAWAGFVLVE